MVLTVYKIISMMVVKMVLTLKQAESKELGNEKTQTAQITSRKLRLWVQAFP